MSHKSSWHTKEDILHDLVVMGQMTNIDEEYLVTGERPPPLRHELDDEMDLRFGAIGDDGCTYKIEQPDLLGITRFIRMVNEDDSHPLELPDDEITIVKPGISTRDPKVNGRANGRVKTGSKSNIDPIPNDRKVPLPDNDIKIVTYDSRSNVDTTVTLRNDQINTVKHDGGKNNLDPKVTSSNDDIKALKLSLKSKLDPTAVEFKPKSVLNSVSNSVVNYKSDTDKTNTTIGSNIESDVKMCKYINLNETVDLTTLNGKEKYDITARLRDKISDTLRADSPQLKKERNVAIANLMKLHSTKPRPSVSTIEQHTEADNTIKLFTPDYYKRCAMFSPTGSNTQRSTPNIDFKKTRMSESNVPIPEPMNSGSIEPVVNSSSSASPEQTTSSSASPEQTSSSSASPEQTSCSSAVPEQTSSSSASPEQTSSSSASPEQTSSNSASPEQTSSSNASPEQTSSSSASPEQTSSISLNSSMEESIKKVHKWFGQSESPRPKAPAVCLGPISFKKKDLSHAKSPTNDTEQKRTQNTAVYRPSQYADDLAKEYMERNKLNDMENETLWTPVIKNLKAKDEIIKQKLKMAETPQ